MNLGCNVQMGEVILSVEGVQKHLNSLALIMINKCSPFLLVAMHSEIFRLFMSYLKASERGINEFIMVNLIQPMIQVLLAGWKKHSSYDGSKKHLLRIASVLKALNFYFSMVIHRIYL